jgi:NADH-quinone oxidoreductase subunit E
VTPPSQPPRPRRPRQTTPTDSVRDRTPSQAGTARFRTNEQPIERPQPGGIVVPSIGADGQPAAEAVTSSASSLPESTVVELKELAGRYPHAQSALLPMLHLVQSSEGFVTPAGIETCAQILDITPAEVSAVATFYTMYKRRPIGDYLVGVCTNTLCAVMGGDAIFERLKSHLDIGNDETTEDGTVTLEHIECNAACDYAPVVMVNWEFFDNQTPQSATDLVDDLRSGRPVTASRGPRVCTWREAERVLAGFPDDRADEGPVGGPATLVGLELARSKRWTAPESSQQASSDGGDTAGRMTTMQAARESETQRAETETVADEDTKAGEVAAPDTFQDNGKDPR